jgi:hypothetical protein
MIKEKQLVLKAEKSSHGVEAHGIVVCAGFNARCRTAKTELLIPKETSQNIIVKEKDIGSWNVP